MLSKIDQHLIKLHDKNHKKAYGKIASTKWGYTLTTICALYNTINEIADKKEEGHLVLAGVFSVIAVLMTTYALLHIFRRKKIEKFEYRLKIFEALIIAYTGYEKWQHIGHARGFVAPYTVVFFICIVVLILSYLFIARMVYLRYNGTIKES